MKFALVYSYHPSLTSPGEAEVQDWITLDNELSAAGVTVHEAGFHPVDQARVVTVRDGQVRDEAAPTAGSTIAGYYVVDVPDLTTAVQVAAKIPTARYGSVQVRQVVEFEA